MIRSLPLNGITANILDAFDAPLVDMNVLKLGTVSVTPKMKIHIKRRSAYLRARMSAITSCDMS